AGGTTTHGGGRPRRPSAGQLRAGVRANFLSFRNSRTRRPASSQYPVRGRKRMTDARRCLRALLRSPEPDAALLARFVPGRAKEERAAGMRDTAATSDGPEPDVREVLDRELAALPEAYRAAVVVCDLEGLGRREAAARLGWTEGTLSGRLARDRALLARR